MDWQSFEKSLPKKIKRTRKRPNVSGFDHEYIKKIDGKLNGKTCVIPGLTKNGKKKLANYVGHLCESATFGKTKSRFMKNAPVIERAPNSLYPQLYKDLKQIAETMFPDFNYNTITLNHNLKCKAHKDGNNVGDSIIIGFGDYKGGFLNVEGESFDIRYKPFKFNGALKTHYTEDFEGERWSAVYFYRKV